MKEKESGNIFAKLGFLVWLVNTNGYDVSMSYRKIAFMTGGRITFTTVKKWLFSLEKYGYITISGKETHKRGYHVNVEKYNNMVKLSNYSLSNLIHIDMDYLKKQVSK